MTIIVSDEEAYEDVVIASGSQDGNVRLWGLKSGKLRFDMSGHKSYIG